MIDLSAIYELIGRIVPCECMDAAFMQRAFLGLILISPIAAAMGVQVINFRMAFFADAIGHSAFAGVALGLILAVSPQITMPVFGVLVGVAITLMMRRSSLSSDTVIGVVFAAVMAFGLAVVSRNAGIAKELPKFLYGDILTIGDTDILMLILLFSLVSIFQILSYNKLLYIGLNPVVAHIHGINVPLYQYTFAVLLALVVMLSIWAVGVLLVTALLIVPAAAGRNFARSARSMFWWAILISVTSAGAGLLVSAQDWAATATGPTVILCGFCWFAVSQCFAAAKRHSGN